MLNKDIKVFISHVRMSRMIDERYGALICVPKHVFSIGVEKRGQYKKDCEFSCHLLGLSLNKSTKCASLSSCDNKSC